MLKTPKLLQAVKDHFGCSSITGVQLEGFVGDIDEQNYLERTVFKGEIMSSGSLYVFDSMMAVSTITAAWLEDTGNY